jgi:hypothetical protein
MTMPELQTLDCFQPALGKLERVKYFNRMLLTAEDMRTDQDFVLQKLRRHNRFLHGWGVVCGLVVKAAPTTALPWRVQIGEGYALGPFGDEIFVGETVFLDLATCGPGATTNPCEPGLMLDMRPAGGPSVYVAIKYAECRARPVLAMPGGCGCDEEACEYSRIRDSFSLECLADYPVSHTPDRDAPTLCEIASGRRLLTCPPCPAEPWVVLAKVTLPVARGTAVAETGIDNKPPVRRLVFSTALIQQQLIKCCCGEGDDGHEPQPPRVANLEIVKQASQIERTGPNREFGVVNFEMKVTNHGPDDALNVTVKDDIGGINPALITILDGFVVAPSGTWSDTTLPGLEASLGPLGANKSAKLAFRMTFKMREVPANAFIENVAIVETDTPLGPQSVPKARVVVPIPQG